MLDDIEGAQWEVFSRIGKSPTIRWQRRSSSSMLKKNGNFPEQTYRMVHAYFPDFKLRGDGIANGLNLVTSS